MKNVWKILSLLLIPVLLISITGAELHFRKCGHTGKLYTNLHFPESNLEINPENCCSDRDEMSCCAESCNAEAESSSCCIDLEKQIITDKDYIFSFHTYNHEVKEIILNNKSLISETDLLDNKTWFSLQLKENIPPPHKLKTSLLL